MNRAVRSYRGEIAYLHAGGPPSGHEWFSATVFADGSRTMRAECQFWQADLVRDVTFTIDRLWRPVDAYLRVARSDRVLGSGWYRFAGDRVTCDGFDVERGAFHLDRVLDSAIPACGYHPIVNDGLWTAMFDLTRSGETQTFPGCVTYSKEMIGNERLGIEPFDLDIAYRGAESVTVPAGTFDTRRFDVSIKGFEAPLEIWTATNDHIVVRERWAQMPTESYDLVRLVRD